MNFLQKAVANAIGLSVRASGGGVPVLGSLTTQYEFSSYTYWPEWYGLYKDNPIAQGCTLAYALTMPEAPLVAMVKGKVVKDHPVIDLIAKAASSYRATISQAFTHIGIAGNSYLIKVRKGQVWARSQLVSDQYITPVPYDDMTTSHYILVSDDGKRSRIEVKDVIHLRGFWQHPERPWLGMSPIELASASIETYNEATRMALSLFKNDAVPRTLIMYPDELDGDQMALIAESFKRRHGGDKKGNVGVLGGGGQLLRLGMDMDDTEATKLMSALETRICSTYRVDPMMAMTMAGLDAAKYSNFKQASKNFTTLTRVPMWMLLADQLTDGIANEYPDVRLMFDITNVEALQPEPAEVQTNALTAYGQGVIDQDEARIALGYKPQVKAAEDPSAVAAASASVDVAALAMNGAQIASLLTIVEQTTLGMMTKETARGVAAVAFPTLSDEQLAAIFDPIVVAEPTTPDASLSIEGDGIDNTQSDRAIDPDAWQTLSFEDADDEVYFRAFDDVATKHSDQLTIDLQGVMERLGKDITSKSLRSVHLRKKAPFDKKKWEAEFEKATAKTRNKMVVDLMRASVKAVNEDWSEIESVLDGVQRDAVAESASMVKEPVTTIYNEMQELLTNNAGATESELKELVNERFETVYGESRCNTIARTTATATTGTTQKDTWARMNEREKDPKRKITRTWLAFPGARGSHAAASGQKEDANGMFKIGSEKTPYPSGPGLSARNACNCRCLCRARRGV